MFIAVIGAGPSGLAVARHLKESGHAYQVFEAYSEVGGVWNIENPRSPVYESTHLISSKKMTEFPDFPMPADFPAYPSHVQVRKYLHAYADHFELKENICFNTKVKNITKSGDQWKISFDGHEELHCDAVIICTGHLSEPNTPEFAGSFSGERLHSVEYKSPRIFDNKTVLIVGAGNSGCDIAVEAAQYAKKAFLSVRRGYHYLPKFIAGQPSDVVGEKAIAWKVPKLIRRWAFQAFLALHVGRPQDYGLPRPDHKLFQSHPIVNSLIYYYLGHGSLLPKPNVSRLAGRQVVFEDGSTEEVDLIVWATGYKVSFPFLDSTYFEWEEFGPKLWLQLFHPRYSNLFFCGYIQPDSGVFWLLDDQARCIVKALGLRGDAVKTQRFYQKMQKLHSQQFARPKFLKTRRHFLEVDHSDYAKLLRRKVL